MSNLFNNSLVNGFVVVGIVCLFFLFRKKGVSTSSHLFLSEFSKLSFDQFLGI